MSMTVLSAAIFAQGGNAKLVEKVVKKGNELVIPYEKYILDNGLTLIIHEDHSDPICYTHVTYHVGSDREQVGRSGFAHFFEHMMFQGSDHVGDNEHFKFVTAAGGSLNGNTTSDRTVYFETLPNNQLETALWLEADRMGFLLDAVTQKKFEVQRATVKNERGQNYDNRPYGLVNEKVGEALYPVGHPYSWSTIGYIEDLNRVDVNDLKKFFLRWYSPNNAVLTVAGDVNTQDVVKLVEKYFGTIPKGPEVKPLDKMPAKLDKDRYISYEDKVRFPLLHIVWPSVANYNPDEAPLDILASILGGDKNSIFYQNFVKSQIAIDARVNNPCSELAGQFTVSIYALPGNTLTQIDSLVKMSLLQFEKRGVNDEDLKKFKASHEADVINSLSSVSAKGIQLAMYQIGTGNPNYIQKDLDRYNKVTKEDVMRVYNQYIKNKPALYLSVYPKGKADVIDKPDNFEIPKRDLENVKESEEYKNLVYHKAKDTFDRSIRPGSGPNPVVKVPEYWSETFANGLRVIGTPLNELPVVTIQLSIDAGHRFEDKNKAGLAFLTANLMNESTQKHSAEQISEMLEMLGSSIDVSANENEIKITINSLTKNIAATTKIAEELLLEPKFDKSEFDRAQKEQLEKIANQVNQPVAIADNVFGRLLYGDNVMGVPAIGTTSSVKSLTLDEVKDYYKTHVSPSVTKLIIVGEVKKEEILSHLSFLKTWKGEKENYPAEPAIKTIDKTRIYFVNKEKAPQSEIRIGNIALPYDATGEFYRSNLMNYTLGGAFNSRINLKIREDKGYSYGARSIFLGNRYKGPFRASAGVRADATAASVLEFMYEITNFSLMGIKPEELAFTKSSMGQNDALQYETAIQKAGFLKRILDYNLDKTFVDKQQEILKGITKEEIDALAKKNLPTEKMYIVVVGDKAKVYEGLGKLGYEIIELDTDGVPLAK
jgi:zinc protease